TMDNRQSRHAEGSVRVRSDHTTARRDDDIGREAAHDRFGGVDVPASLVGMLTALAIIMLLGGVIAAAIGAFGYQSGVEVADAEELGIAGLVGGIVTLFVAFLIGGWAAARIARYDGKRNGIMTVVWTVLLSAIFAAAGTALGSEYDVFQSVNLPRWSTSDDATVAGIVSLAVALLAAVLGALLGGAWGERYHRRADATIAGTREGGIASTRRVEPARTVRTEEMNR
ncbi:MAG: conserved rane protein of unknown function, partial [Thermoleophilia bacterium]|nr:conserved rane protein of unknown function [Thermoleophilia bacterium]